MTWKQTIKNAWLDFSALLLPVRCAGCGRWDRDFCDPCRREVIALAQAPPPYPYEGIAGNLVRGFKLDCKTHLWRALLPMLARVRGSAPPDAVWIPMPSIPEHVRERGFAHIPYLLRKAGVPRAQIVPVLQTSPGRVAQLGLSQLEREKNAKLLRVREKYLQKLVGSRAVVLFDDVTTTGASMRTAADFLARAGVQVSACYALCTTVQNGGVR